MKKETNLESRANPLNNKKLRNNLNKICKYIAENSWKLLPIGLERYYFMNRGYKKTPPTQY